MANDNIGRKPNNLNENIVDEIFNLKDQIILDEIAGIKSDVWKNISFNISSKYNKNITPAALRVRVALNRGGIRDKLGLISSKENKDDFSTVCSPCTDDDEMVIFNDLEFSITFSDNEWQAIKPKTRTYEEKQGPRTYQIMSPYEWTNIVQEHFFMHTRLPCCLVFKKSYINVNYGTYISVRGHCSDCGSVFEGSIKRIPDEDSW
ncbi:C2H2-type domain-containing protein [Aphis craccivora]|uniref:C2H2-type domain-containing protein n=1 Tax=Aphis craccivora TaxID=307492 RepID=A0A6G0Y1J4_APHCR|nr:C2H2-type domain-containing protein [Aphis craccivora]